MLVLTRNINDFIKIGDNVDICILGVKGNQVKLGINAPKEISVHRQEVYERIKRQKNMQKKASGESDAFSPALMQI
jgi:carbon storage regulator